MSHLKTGNVSILQTTCTPRAQASAAPCLGVWNSLITSPTCAGLILYPRVNTLRARQNGRRFADDIFKYTFLNENIWISINTSPNVVPHGQINNVPSLVQITAWCRPGDKPLSELMMVSLLTHVCVTLSQMSNVTSLSDLSWKFHEYLSLRFTVIWLTAYCRWNLWKIMTENIWI